MPVVLTFDLAGATPLQRNRIQNFFERFGWQNLGGSSYRYPPLGNAQAVEDRFNDVVPALMLFRAFVRDSESPLSKYTLDVQSSSGYDPATGFGHAPIAGGDPRVPAAAAKGIRARQLARLDRWYPFPVHLTCDRSLSCSS